MRDFTGRLFQVCLMFGAILLLIVSSLTSTSYAAQDNSSQETFKFLTKWGSYGAGDGQFHNGPYGIAVDSSGYVYVTDTNGGRVEKFTSDGTFLRSRLYHFRYVSS
ncbi:MAG: hypothetical protein HQK99_07325 [Nitrospirae bacterium]|nr:hypothetical protein [Nitrospirota bacterium]